MTDPTAELLQALEHAADEIRRLSLVLRQVLEAQQRGGVELQSARADDSAAQRTSIHVGDTVELRCRVRV